MKHIRIPGSKSLLARILADPALPEKINQLSATELVRIIHQVGLEDCGEIVALATTEQLCAVFDEDLWRSEEPTKDEVFNSERFSLWLEVLMELGAQEAAKKVIQMDQDFLVMAFSQLIWAVKFEDLRLYVAHENRLEKLLDSSHSYELQDFYVFSRLAGSWDTVLNLLVELDREHHSFLIRMLEACAHFTLEAVEESGTFFEVLSSEEKLKSDVAYEREKRREALGYVTPAEARAFLKLASGPLNVTDHVSPKELREKTLRRKPGQNQLTSSMKASQTHALEDTKLRSYPRVREFLEWEAEQEGVHRGMEQLNYLANVLISGHVIRGRSPRAAEAANLVLKVCEVGFQKKSDCTSFLEAFRMGWKK